jgi:hypothetical protein
MTKSASAVLASDAVHRLIPAVPFAVGLCIGMLICLELGRRLGLRRLAKDPKAEMANFGVVEGAVLGLYGLLIAFTFSGASARFDARRQLVAEEANAIGTAYLRVDLLPAESQPVLREQFRTYVDSRLSTYRNARGFQEFKAGLAGSARLQSEIWQAAVAATRLPGAHPDAARLMLPALNEMIDITTTRTMAMRIHPPLMIFALLFIMALACSTMAGYAMAVSMRRSWLHIAAFIAASVIAGYVVLEIEYPRTGFIRLDVYDQVLIEVRESMQ